MRLKYTVCLPPGYDLPRNAHRRYPVIYLLHGWPGNTRQWIVQGGLLSSLNALSQEHEIQPMIVVSPEAMPSKNDPVNEYLNSYLGNWETYVYRDLVRLMDTHYRTIPSPRGRAIAGLSTGGYGAMNIGLQHRDVFGLIGSFSGYFILPSTDQLVRNEPELERLDSPMYYLPKLEGSLPPMYLYVGAQDRRHVAENEEFARLLAARHADYFFATYPGGHTWQLWKDHLPGFLIWASRRLA